MGSRKGTFVALLRGINLSGQHKVPMAELRSACTKAGCEDVRTYIQSGNVVLSATAAPAQLESQLEGVIDRQFGFRVPVIVRSSAQWERYVEANPFPDESKSTPNWVVLALSKSPPASGAVPGLQERASKGERVVGAAGVLWIHYAAGIARSKLTPAVLDRLAGSAVTVRNWRTVLKLDQMIRET
jgi:uncharacterized protein (DUF1697 family)